MDEKCYWLWFQYGLGYGGQTKAAIDYFASPKNMYEALDEQWLLSGAVKKRSAAYKRLAEKKPEDFSEIIDFCQKHKIKILTAEDEYYPEKLLETENYPAVLYVRGNYKCLKNKKPVAVIGSRTPCVYGEKAAEDIVGKLSDKGALIVSGGALGIDSIAHKTALAHEASTVLVLGHGHGYSYLAENAELRRSVAATGALISEYPPLTPVSFGTFPERNRIISGMSEAVVIIEAADRSGTFNTANHARRQGRELMVLPGDINSGNFSGSNQLIREGARAVFSGEDVLNISFGLDEQAQTLTHKNGEAFKNIDVRSAEGKGRQGKKKSLPKEEPKEAISRKKAEKAEKIEKNIPEGISKNAGIVYNIMSDDINVLDEITRQSSLAVRDVLVALTELEMLGFVFADGPGSYRIK